MSVSRNVFATEWEPVKKHVKKPKVRTLLPHDLTKLERKTDKKKQHAESAQWKHRRNKEIQRFRERKYTEPLDDPLDFSAETFSNELSSRKAHNIQIIHTFMLRYREASVKRMTATIYCSPNSTLYGNTPKVSDDIVVIKSMDVGFHHKRVRHVLRGDWMILEKEIMSMCDYGMGCYTLSVDLCNFGRGCYNKFAVM